ncbi:hypothetical protein CP335_22590 [Pseudomonas fluorescens]|uniref:YobI-like P-loop NTPase domain-containing protein n=1 Tax=Pseudomonas fluorescens TaxID=294 RepID=A0A854WZA5_PSEFL|nr:hypothetical protein [Pseudomonas fluorescens]PCM47370.1 hypothetical protein CP335_22590 [Pseudomonas fluorescens]
MMGFNKLLAKLQNTSTYKRITRRFHTKSPLRNSFVDLAPIDFADQDGLYQEALRFAMCNASIRNVAITGPYGSGKTSVIKTFEKNSPYRSLNVSLATFSDPNSLTPPLQDSQQIDVTVKVERSILQQMLYGAGSGTLPYSRFKRISKPRWVDLNAILFVGWIASVGMLYQNHDKLLKALSNQTLEWVWIFTAAYVLLYLARTVSKAIQASHSLSVKKLSLQSGEVELDGIPESSILNKHLDEIIYFFEENDYDLVVFEDLDRFGNPEIFIKLREINKIINDRPKRKGTLPFLSRTQPLKFVYAIKDDIFLNKDRAKFFDFILPIIPIINNSNSREVLKRSIESAGYGIGVQDRFIGEVSLYLDDMRLIKNISNEFLIYEKKVGSSNLNVNRLLAAIIYKNAYPKDFENLHHGGGALHEIVQRRTSILIQSASNIDFQIEELRTLIQESDHETSTAIVELVKLFWGHLCSTYNEYDIVSVYSGETPINISQLLEWNNFEKIFQEKNLNLQVRQRNQYNNYEQRLPLSLSFKNLEEAIFPGTTFTQRHRSITNKKAKNRTELNAQIEKLKSEKSSLARQPLCQLLMLCGFEISDIAKQHNIDDPRLLNYFIRNGHIDETYHLYISTFHEGRMSRNDWDFILSIRDFRTPDPASQVDNPAEVLEELREEDFGSGHSLNVHLIDELIQNGTTNTKRIQMVLDYFSNSLPESQKFFDAYWLIGKNTPALTRIIAQYWPGYGMAAIDASSATQHVASIIAYVEPDFVAEQMNIGRSLSDYISKHAAVIFAENIVFEKSFQALELLKIKIEQISDCSQNIALVNYAHQQDLYRITADNIKFLVEQFGAPVQQQEHYTNHLFDLESANYTAILESGSDSLKSYIDRNINSYVRDVACAIDSNNSESPNAIVRLLNHSEIDPDMAIKFALQQDHVFANFDDLPAYQWDELLYNEKVNVTWPNILRFYGLDDSDKDRLNEILGRNAVYQALSEQKIPITKGEEELVKSLCRFLISDHALSEVGFRALCKSVPYRYQSFPEGLPEEFSIILIDLEVIKLNDISFSETQSSASLRAKLIEKSFLAYTTAMDKYPLSQEVITLLLTSTLSMQQKCFILGHITVNDLSSNAELAKHVSQLLGREDLIDKDFDLGMISYCLANAPKTLERKNILYNFVDILPEAEIISAMLTLESPFADLAKRGMRPKLENTERNRRFAKSLVDRKIISSQKPNGDHIRLNTFK